MKTYFFLTFSTAKMVCNNIATANTPTRCCDYYLNSKTHKYKGQNFYYKNNVVIVNEQEA